MYPAELWEKITDIVNIADTLAYRHQSLNHSVWHSVWLAAKTMREGGSLPEVITSYLSNVPECPPKTRLIAIAQNTEDQFQFTDNLSQAA